MQSNLKKLRNANEMHKNKHTAVKNRLTAVCVGSKPVF